MRRYSVVWIFVVAALSVAGPAPALLSQTAISGHVTDLAGQPLPDICVFASSDRYSSYSGAYTDANGDYRFSLTPGSYKIHFEECVTAEYRTFVMEWWNDKPDFDSADVVMVAEGETVPGIDAALARTTLISGRVSDGTGSGIESICVWANGPEFWDGYARTGPDGSFVVPGLRDGTYRVRFSDCGSPTRFATEWYDDATDEASAAPVDVPVQGEAIGIDAVLAPGGRISGVVSDADGMPLASICVYAHDRGGDSIAQGSTGLSGRYVFGGLRTGSYTVEFADCRWPPIYGGKWWNDEVDSSAADPVSVVEGAETSGIDAVLKRAMTDLGITNLAVDPKPIETDYGPMGYTGLVRNVRVEISNLGDLDVPYAKLILRACPAPSGSCRRFAEEDFALVAGGVLRRDYQWNAIGMVGDVIIEAQLACNFRDANGGNNSARVQHYAIAGGIGFGIDTLGLVGYESGYVCENFD